LRLGREFGKYLNQDYLSLKRFEWKERRKGVWDLINALLSENNYDNLSYFGILRQFHF